jgi:hypothetical protein
MTLDPQDIEAIAAAVAARLAVPAQLPYELTVEQAMLVTNHRSARAFHYWCKRRRVRPIARGRYSRRRLEAALSA